MLEFARSANVDGLLDLLGSEGEACSTFQATVAAWQPMHRDWSRTKASCVSEPILVWDPRPLAIPIGHRYLPSRNDTSVRRAARFRPTRDLRCPPSMREA
jgi:hypothetical protein